MGLSRLLPILVPFIVLWSVQELGLVEGSRSKRCPRFRIKCEVRERDQCSIRRPCPGNLKCCMYSCGKKCLDLRQDICSMPKDTGPCLAYIQRWWYNKEARNCYKFIYGGCLGNSNNFQSESICMTSCHKKRWLQPWQTQC